MYTGVFQGSLQSRLASLPGFRPKVLCADYSHYSGESNPVHGIHLAALCHCQLVTDPTCVAPSFHTPFMNLVLRGIKRVRAQENTAPHTYRSQLRCYAGLRPLLPGIPCNNEKKGKSSPSLFSHYDKPHIGIIPNPSDQVTQDKPLT